MSELFKIFTREEFDKALGNYNLPSFYDGDYVYEVYVLANEAIKQLTEMNVNMEVTYVNPLELTNYVLGEFIYGCEQRSGEALATFKANEDIKASIASVAADKYLSLSMFNYKERKIVNRFLPPISSLNLYLNFIQNALEFTSKNDPKTIPMIATPKAINKGNLIVFILQNLFLNNYILFHLIIINF